FFGSMNSVRRGWLGSEMLTRRTATVTISAPDASTAAAFSPRLLYLPVPTISRELNVRPATVQRSDETDCGAFTSAPADEMDDLEGVPFRHPNLAESRARHDREVALDRDLPGVHPELAQHLCDGHSDCHPARVAVDVDREAVLQFHGSRNRSAPERAQTPLRRLRVDATAPVCKSAPPSFHGNHEWLKRRLRPARRRTARCASTPRSSRSLPSFSPPTS